MKQPLLLIPGLLCNEVLWEHQVKALKDIAEIQIADTLNDGSIKEMATRNIDIMQKRFPDQSFAVAGLSMGGYVAFDILRQTDKVNKLALLDTRAQGESDQSAIERKKLMAVVKGHERFVGMSDDQLPRYIHPSRIKDMTLIGKIREMTQDVGKEAFLNQQNAIITRSDSTQLLNEIKLPALILCGENDILTPVAEHEFMATRISNSKLEVVPDCGHLSTMERPDSVSAILKSWLLN